MLRVIASGGMATLPRRPPYSLTARSLSALLITDTELRLIASAASIGDIMKAFAGLQADKKKVSSIYQSLK